MITEVRMTGRQTCGAQCRRQLSHPAYMHVMSEWQQYVRPLCCTTFKAQLSSVVGSRS